MMNLNYNKVLEMVNYVLFSYDLTGVIFDEYSQEDEYIEEAKEITEYIMKTKDVNTLGCADYIQTVFVKYFETLYSFEDCYEVAYDILNNFELCKEVK